jgi:hypothetical protein
MAKAESELRSILDGGFDREKFPWYLPDLEEVPEPAKTLLEKYSKISPGEVVQHVKTVVRIVLTRFVIVDTDCSPLARSGFLCGE